MIYSVFLRNHFAGHTFSDLSKDLPRIKDLGTEWVWLMPFYPLGVKDRKGNPGSPYAIRDYRGIDPYHGKVEDFQKLIENCRKNELKLMIDIVFHHTAPDHPWLKDHPDFYCRDSHGSPVAKIAEWSDVVDLDFTNQKMQDELIATLGYWAGMGVEGFRCDVAPLVPMSFWMRAKKSLAEVGFKITWLSESLSATFIDHCRSRGLVAHSDAEVAEVFDWGYDYFHHEAWLGAIHSREGLAEYIAALNQELQNPTLARSKLRFVENHDQRRIRERLAGRGGEESARAWELFMALLPGQLLVYAGEEFASKHQPSLFERDPCLIEKSSPWIRELVSFTKRLQTRSSVKEIGLTGSGVRFIRSDSSMIEFPVNELNELRLPVSLDLKS